jgi:hypothetical protein
MSGSEKSSDSVTLPFTGYSLKPMFIFINCTIMNIVMFNCCLNLHTCTWIVSLTAILKCQIDQNIDYHLAPWTVAEGVRLRREANRRQQQRSEEAEERMAG